MDRRSFLNHSTRVLGGTVAGFSALQALAACGKSGIRPPVAGRDEGGYGPLREAGPELALPEGFRYRVIGIEGTPMADGHVTPSRHDGMCALPLPNGNIRLIRNHEVMNPPRDGGAFGHQATAYDPRAGGGTTSLEIDPVTRELVRDFVSLNGTLRNCAGGPTPWGSWLSCEEIVARRNDTFPQFAERLGAPAASIQAWIRRGNIEEPFLGVTQGHGYIFEVPAALEEARAAEPIPAMGWFVHEAVAVDPATGIVYETEDRGSAGLYQFLPKQPYVNGEGGDLTAGGRLQMLAIRDQPNYDTDTGQVVGRTLPVVWVDIDDPDPKDADNPSAVFEQGWDAGGARFSRLEGCWYGEGGIYVVATSGGDAGQGQVWQVRPNGPETGKLTLVFESPSQSVLSNPDNVCVSPRGGIVLCEDGRNDPQYVRGLTPDGRIFDVAANLANDGEVAGATFSPDGRTLFFNAQGGGGSRGMTFAVWGPWEEGTL